MNQIKVFVAEDTKETRKKLIEALNEFSVKQIGSEGLFVIDKTESAEKAKSKLEECDKHKNYYDIFFCDIDFTEGGGDRDAGFELIQEAFKICPITKICTYSGQFHTEDLWPKYEELKQLGLIVHTMNKSHGKGGESEWFRKNIGVLVKKVEEEKYLSDLWLNHQSIWEKIKTDVKEIHQLNRYYEIKSNLDTITLLLQRKTQFNADVILFRLVLQLYHRCLEIFVSGDKSEDKIVEESNLAKDEVFGIVRDLIKNDDDREFKDRKSFLRKIAAFSPTKIYRYGHILNWYRNGSVHPNKKFIPELLNVLFANLTFAAYILDGDFKSIKYNEFKKIANSEGNNPIAQKDFQSLLGFIEER